MEDREPPSDLDNNMSIKDMARLCVKSRRKKKDIKLSTGRHTTIKDDKHEQDTCSSRDSDTSSFSDLTVGIDTNEDIPEKHNPEADHKRRGLPIQETNTQNGKPIFVSITVKLHTIPITSKMIQGNYCR